MSDTATTTKVFEQEEIAKHNTHDDLWVVLNGKVYDISQYIDEHPGGEEVILDVAGGDCTEAFDDIGHSDEAHEILKKLYIGNLKGAAPTQAKHAQSANSATDEQGLNFPLVAVFVLLLAYAAYYLKSQL
ncbi:Cytochrome b5 [Spathaspora sp. JA1]|nr:Cytochrome b5 [Spathaspora sp. JA1]